MIKGKLDAWRVLKTVVDEGGYTQAARALGRSQSAVSYTIAQLQHQLGIALVQTEGRRAVLTEAGSRLLERARDLLHEHQALNDLADYLRLGVEAELYLDYEPVIPIELLSGPLAEMAARYPNTRIHLNTDRSKMHQAACLSLTTRAPDLTHVRHLTALRWQPVVSPHHPLADMSTVGHRELANYPLVSVLDPTPFPVADVTWQVGLHEAIHLIEQGLGFGWLPIAGIKAALAQGRLTALKLETDRFVDLPVYLGVNTHYDGPASAELVRLLEDAFHGVARSI